MNSQRKDPFWRWTLAGTCLMGVVTIWSTVRNEWFAQPPKPIGDGMCYEVIAFSLYSGNGFRENYATQSWKSIYEGSSQYDDFLSRVSTRNVAATGRPPLYPVIVACVYKVLGRGPMAFMAIRLVAASCLAIAGGLAAGLCVKILQQVGKNNAIVTVAGGCTLVLAASQRTLRDYATDFLTEPLALMLTQIFVALVVFELLHRNRNQERSPNADSAKPSINLWRWVVAGVMFGLMVLTRSLFIVWLPGVLLILFISIGASNRDRLVSLSAFTMAALAVCCPWWIHNCVALKRFMPLGTQGPIALAGGYCDQSYADGGNWSFEPEKRIRQKVAQQDTRETSSDQTQIELVVVEECKKEVSQWAKQNWQLLPTLAIKRAISHWNPYTGRALLWKIAILSGLLWCVRGSRELRWWLVGLPILSTAVTMALYETGGRFLVPLYGLLFTLAGLGVSGWLPAKRKD